MSQVFTILEYMSFFFGQSSSLFTRKLKAYWCKDCGPKSSIVWDPAAALGPFLSDLFRVSWSSLLCFWGLSPLFGLFYNSKSISVQFHLILVITVNEKAKCMHVGDLIFNWTNIGNSFKVHIAYRLISVGQNLFHVKGSNTVFLSKSCNFWKTTKIQFMK